jgi:hypothetical protein
MEQILRDSNVYDRNLNKQSIRDQDFSPKFGFL